VAPSDPDLVKAHHNLMSFQRSNRTVNTSRTVARKLLRRSDTTPFVTRVRVPVLAEEYVGVLIPVFNPTHIESLDVHGKHDGERGGSFGYDASR
jgi:hypothetical protein